MGVKVILIISIIYSKGQRVLLLCFSCHLRYGLCLEWTVCRSLLFLPLSLLLNVYFDNKHGVGFRNIMFSDTESLKT